MEDTNSEQVDQNPEPGVEGSIELHQVSVESLTLDQAQVAQNLVGE